MKQKLIIISKEFFLYYLVNEMFMLLNTYMRVLNILMWKENIQ